MILTYAAGYCMINEYPLAVFSYKGVYNYQEFQIKEALYCLTLPHLR